MKIFNTRIYGLKESIIASGYPMQTEIIDWDTLSEEEFEQLYIKRLKKAISLGNCKSGTGHDCFTKGIIVQADFEAPQHFWLQWLRYHFQDIISSESKMHRLPQMNIGIKCTKYVDQIVLNRLKELQYEFNQNPTHENFRRLLDSCPSGFMLTARITTNYLQLKTERKQREHHKNEEWNTVFVNWTDNLPLFKELCLSAKSSL